VLQERGKQGQTTRPSSYPLTDRFKDLYLVGEITVPRDNLGEHSSSKLQQEERGTSQGPCLEALEELGLNARRQGERK